MTSRFTDVARVLRSLIATDPMPAHKLPISVNENTVCNFKSGDAMDSFKLGSVLAPHSLVAEELALMRVTARVGTEGPATFVLASKASIPLHEGVISALAAGTEVRASLLVAGPGAVLAPVEIQASVDGVLFIVAFPVSTPIGSRVVINRVWVAGCEVVVDELSSSITIGFNHAPAPEGAMIEAALAGDLSGVCAALYLGSLRICV